MADNFQVKMEGLKKSYAEMIMKASKDESLRLFLRFHDHFNFKITEAETRSLNQQMKIEELEAQLAEAEDIIVDLREQLKQVLDQLEIVRERNNSNEPFKGQIPSAHELINGRMLLDSEKSYPVNEYNISEPKSIPLDHNSDGMVVNKCGQAVANTTMSMESELNHYKDGITSFVQPNRETYLFKNGCTERVCAIESKPFIELSPPETVQTVDNFHPEKSGSSGQCPVIENKLITNNPIHLEARLGYGDQSSANLQSAKNLEKADSCSQNPVIDNSHMSGDLILCEKLDDANQDQLTNLSAALNSGDDKCRSFKYPQLRKVDGNGNSGDKPSSVGSYNTTKNEKTFEIGLQEQVVHESGNHKAQESRSCRRSPGKNARYKEAISILRRSCRKKPSKSWHKPRPCQQKVLSSGTNEESVEVPIEFVDKMPKTEVCGATKSDDTGSSCQLKFVNDLVYDEQDGGIDSNLVDVPVIDGLCNPRSSENNGRALKFTFYRKRRKNVLTNIDENIASDRSNVKRRM